MPQHPRYTNSPSRNLDKLYELLNQLEGFGIIHEEIHQSLDSVMADLYPSAVKKFAIEEKSYGSSSDEDEDEDEDDELDEFDNDFLLPAVSTLFDYIEPDEQEQFIQDFRNTIAHRIHSGTWDTDGASDQIIDQRDIEYYKMHIYLEEDTETNDKYRYSSRTVWFPEDINPARIGIYEISSLDYQNAKHAGFAYWNGKKWFNSKVLLKDCIDQKRTKENEKSWGSYCWRGFLEQLTN
jgi:hypothetical protein